MPVIAFDSSSQKFISKELD